MLLSESFQIPIVSSSLIVGTYSMTFFHFFLNKLYLFLMYSTPVLPNTWSTIPNLQIEMYSLMLSIQKIVIFNFCQWTADLTKAVQIERFHLHSLLGQMWIASTDENSNLPLVSTCQTSFLTKYSSVALSGILKGRKGHKGA